MENQSSASRLCPTCQSLRPPEELVCAICRTRKPSQNSDTAPIASINCRSCGAIQKSSSHKFCSQCGDKLDQEISKIVFCTSCGNKIESIDTFCSNCGQKRTIKTIEEMSHTETKTKQVIPVVKTDKILKSDEFRLMNSILGEKGKLSLYVNRLVWDGKSNIIKIPMDRITNVAVINTSLVISAQDYKFNFSKINLLEVYTIFTNPLLAAVSQNQGDLESWRSIIDKIRMNM